jgi:hypothetical protein
VRPYWRAAPPARAPLCCFTARTREPRWPAPPTPLPGLLVSPESCGVPPAWDALGLWGCRNWAGRVVRVLAWQLLLVPDADLELADVGVRFH